MTLSAGQIEDAARVLQANGIGPSYHAAKVAEEVLEAAGVDSLASSLSQLRGMLHEMNRPPDENERAPRGLNLSTRRLRLNRQGGSLMLQGNGGRFAASWGDWVSLAQAVLTAYTEAQGELPPVAALAPFTGRSGSVSQTRNTFYHDGTDRIARLEAALAILNDGSRALDERAVALETVSTLTSNFGPFLNRTTGRYIVHENDYSPMPPLREGFQWFSQFIVGGVNYQFPEEFNDLINGQSEDPQSDMDRLRAAGIYENRDGMHWIAVPVTPESARLRFETDLAHTPRVRNPRDGSGLPSGAEVVHHMSEGSNGRRTAEAVLAHPDFQGLLAMGANPATHSDYRHERERVGARMGVQIEARRNVISAVTGEAAHRLTVVTMTPGGSRRVLMDIDLHR